MNRTFFQVFKRYMHDRKLPSVIFHRMSTPSSLIGTQSPKKADYNPSTQKSLLYGHFNNLNEVVKARKKISKQISEIYIKNSI